MKLIETHAMSAVLVVHLILVAIIAASMVALASFDIVAAGVQAIK